MKRAKRRESDLHLQTVVLPPASPCHLPPGMYVARRVLIARIQLLGQSRPQRIVQVLADVRPVAKDKKEEEDP